MSEEIPRRARVDQWSPAERAIADAVAAVEKAGASEALTRAVILLGEARDRVADHVDANRVRVYVGAGCDAKDWKPRGWLCNDIAEAAAVWPGIDLIGPCWALPLEDNSVDEIMAKGMIEHLTYHEVAKAFAEWRRVLKPGGFFTGEVPDVDEYIRKYLEMRQGTDPSRGEGESGAEGEPDDAAACGGIDRWLRRALYGWQRWPGDEHRSGWTESLFDFYLRKHFAGARYEIRRMGIDFDTDVPGYSRVRHLWCRAWK